MSIFSHLDGILQEWSESGLNSLPVVQDAKQKYYTLVDRILLLFCCFPSRKCDVDRLPLTCSLPLWDGNWTLMAVNNLGHYSLSDSAELSHRGTSSFTLTT